MMPNQGATQREFTRALCEVPPGLTHAPLNHQFRDGLQHGPSLRGNFLSSEEHEPNTGESDRSDTYANDKQQQNGWAWFGLTSFHWCFDNNAVLLFHHDCDLNLGCEVGAINYRDNFNIVWRGIGWCVFRSVAQRLVGCIQAVH